MAYTLRYPPLPAFSASHPSVTDSRSRGHSTTGRLSGVPPGVWCAVLTVFILYCVSGREPEAKVLDAMLNESPGPLNFTTFLTLFGDKMKGKVLV